jgi:hypothetical protein
MRAAWTWLEAKPVRALAIAVALVIALRIPFLGSPLTADEGGYLYVAQHWDGDGPLLYDHQWVDRPPLLLAVFKFASLTGGAVELRLIALVLTCIVVFSGWWAGRIINGSPGAVVGALVAAATGSNFLLHAFALVGEGIASAFMMTSCALMLEAGWSPSRRGTASTRQACGMATAAGVLAVAAFLTKQNMLDSAVFAVFLLVPALRTSWPILLAWVAGAAAPLAVAVAWASSSHGPGVGPFWNALFGFRAAAAAAIVAHPLVHELHRMRWLAVLFVLSGMALLSWQLVTAAVRDRSQRRLGVALVVTLAYGLVSIALGANWWRHYLLELVPVLTMGAALATRGRGIWIPRAWSVRLVTSVAVASAVIVTFVNADHGAASAEIDRDVAISSWLTRASRPNDSVVLTFGHANIIESADLTTPYRYSWTLPARLRDRHFHVLVRVLNGPAAPTWLIQISSPRVGIRYRSPALRASVGAHYRLFARVCRRSVFLHDGITRRHPPPATDC